MWRPLRRKQCSNWGTLWSLRFYHQTFYHKIGRNVYEGHMDKAKGGWDQGWEVGMAGVEGSCGGKIETILLEQQLKKKKKYMKILYWYIYHKPNKRKLCHLNSWKYFLKIFAWQLVLVNIKSVCKNVNIFRYIPIKTKKLLAL